MNNGLTKSFVLSLATIGTVFSQERTGGTSGNWGGGVFLSTNSGTNWVEVNNGLTDT